ncbi:hypothetical protein KTN05_16800 [Paracoccus sp. Z118]|uniref:hypothetical protein n=1 Tax=Paracoccus sp. Z118 TaxID=2851017 RepID=UPI001C2CBA21|nr:hypothetical protein [Paracoccus sp. Z118]MBV0893461.1 hypothetical protein [Paracoccus sp. Z118]
MNALTLVFPDDAPRLPVGLTCPKCNTAFSPKLSNQRYCGVNCQKAATRNTARGSRTAENAQRRRDHYQRAAWLCYDLNRMNPDDRVSFTGELILAARDHDGKLRNILTDPSLLGASRGEGIGKLFPDSHNREITNIAKVANAYCRARWGAGVKAVMLGHSVPPDAPQPSLADMEGRRQPKPQMPDGWDYRSLLSDKWSETASVPHE